MTKHQDTNANQPPHGHPGGHPGHGGGGRDGAPWPRVVFWETTAACNLECAHCRRLDVSRELSKSDLTTEEGFSLIDQLAEGGRTLLILSGGEPLMRADIFDLAERARERDLPCALATNGTTVNREVAGQIAAAGIRRVSISLDGAKATTHDEFRRLPGSFEQALEGVANLREAGVPVQINMTLAKHNYTEMEALFKLTEELDACALHIFALVPVGCGVEIADDEMLQPDQCEATLLRFYELSKETSLETRATCAPQYSRIARQQKVIDKRKGEDVSDAPDPGRGCLAGSAVCFVSHEGKVFPCGYLPAEAGDVRRQPFAEIWRDSEVFAKLRRPDLLGGKCGHCEFAQVCMGCRARAYGQTGDYMAEEPSCPYVPRRHQNAS